MRFFFITFQGDFCSFRSARKVKKGEGGGVCKSEYGLFASMSSRFFLLMMFFMRVLKHYYSHSFVEYI